MCAELILPKPTVQMEFLPICSNLQAQALIAPLLFNLSIHIGYFPQPWKTLSIVPIPKASKHQCPTNYRPISLLSILSKMLELHFHTLISTHLARNHPLSNCQWGFNWENQPKLLSWLLPMSSSHNWRPEETSV